MHQLVTSKTRLRLVMKFYLTEEETYLRELVRECKESTNAIRLELRRLYDMNLITDRWVKNRRYYKINKNYYLHGQMESLIKQYLYWDELHGQLKGIDWKTIYITPDPKRSSRVEYVIEVEENSPHWGKQFYLGEGTTVTFATTSMLNRIDQVLISVARQKEKVS